MSVSRHLTVSALRRSRAGSWQRLAQTVRPSPHKSRLPPTAHAMSGTGAAPAAAAEAPAPAHAAAWEQLPDVVLSADEGAILPVCSDCRTGPRLGGMLDAQDADPSCTGLSPPSANTMHWPPGRPVRVSPAFPAACLPDPSKAVMFAACVGLAVASLRPLCRNAPCCGRRQVPAPHPPPPSILQPLCAHFLLWPPPRDGPGQCRESDHTRLNPRRRRASPACPPPRPAPYPTRTWPT